MEETKKEMALIVCRKINKSPCKNCNFKCVPFNIASELYDSGCRIIKAKKPKKEGALFLCPSCDNYVYNERLVGKDQGFCDNCGQALDWNKKRM